MMTSSMAPGAMPERRTASFITIAPSWGAVKLARLLRNLPVGVLAAPTITGICSVICDVLLLCFHAVIERVRFLFIVSFGREKGQIQQAMGYNKSDNLINIL